MRTLTLLAVLLLAFSSHADCLPTPSGLVGWWPGDGNANNVLGTNHGTLQGGATASVPGLAATTFNFDGTNGYVSIPDSPALRPTNFTIEAWVKLDGLDSPGTANPGVQFFVFKQNSRASYFEGFWLGKSRSTGSDTFIFGVSSAAGVFVPVRSATIQTGVWYHVTAVRGPDYIRLYTNGQFAAQATVNFPQDYGDHPLYFGTSGQTGYDRKLKGSLDEVTLYNRALSSNEITAVFAAGAAGKCKAPVIITQPQGQIVFPGSNVTFSIEATGFGALNCQWRFNGGAISGATESSLILTNVQLADMGDYSVIVAQPWGSVTSAVATLTVIVPPAISSSPTNQVVEVGLTANFGVQANGTPPLSFHWQKNEVDLFNGGRVSGADTATLVLANAQTSDDGAYRVVVSNAYGMVTSVVATLKVGMTLPGLKGAAVVWGDYDNDGLMDVLMAGATANGTRFARLYHNVGSKLFEEVNVALPQVAVAAAAWGDYDNDGDLDFLITGEKYEGSQIAVSAVYRNDGNGVFTDTNAGLQAQSNADVIWVDFDNDGHLDIYLALFGQFWHNQGNGTFAPHPNGTGGAYPGRVDRGDFDNDGDQDFTLIAPLQFNGMPPSIVRNDGAGGFLRSLLSPSSTYSYSYSFSDYDNDGDLDVMLADYYAQEPVRTYQNDGVGNLILTDLNMRPFSALASAWGDYNNDGKPDCLTMEHGTEGDLVEVLFDEGTNWNHILWFASVWQAAASFVDIDTDGDLDVFYTGGFSSFTTFTRSGFLINSIAATNTPPQPPSGLSHEIIQPNTVILRWTPSTDAQTPSPGLNYNLRVGTTPGGVEVMSPASDLATGRRQILERGNAGSTNFWILRDLPIGNYHWSVQAIDPTFAGSAFAAVDDGFSITAAPPKIVTQPESQNVVLGSNANFFVTATGTGPLSYQWQKDGTNVLDEGNITGATSSSLTISGVQSNDAGSYRLALSSPFGSVTTYQAFLTIWYPPTITTQPANRTVPVGTNLSLSAVATGTSILQFRWQKDGVNLSNGGQISGADTPTLLITGAQTNNSGNYTVVVTNIAGSVTSAVAIVSVLIPPAVVAQPTNQVQTVGGNASFAVQATGDEPLSYQWQREGVSLLNGGRINGANSSVLVISDIQNSDYGAYRVVVSNPAASVTSQVALLQAFNLSLVGAYDTPGDARAVELNSPFAVVADGAAGVRLMDVSNPALPASVGVYDTPGTANSLSLFGQFTVVADNTAVRLVDLSNPQAPFPAGALTNPNGVSTAVVVAGSYAYNVGPQGFWVLDFRIPTQPLLSASLTSTTVGYPVAVQVQDNYAYVASAMPPPGGSSLGLCIISLTNPAMPVRVGLYDSPGNAQGMAVVGNLAFLADGAAGLQIVDVSNRASPVRIGGYDTPGNALSVCVTNQLVFVADDTAGVVVLDVSNPLQPVRLTTYDTPGNAKAVRVAGPYLLVADGSSGLRVLTGFPTSAVDLPPTNFPPAIIQEPAGVTMLRSNTASFGTIIAGTLPLSHQWYCDGALIEGLTNSWLTFSNVQPASAGLYFGVTSNAFGVVTSAVARLDVWAITNLGRYFINQRDNPVSVAVRGQYAFIADASLGLSIIDVSVPTNPRLVGNYSPKPGNANGVKVRGRLAYLAAGGAGLEVIDVSDPAKPVRLGGYDTTGNASKLDLVWPLAYVADGTAGVQIIDVTTPSGPVRLGGYDTIGTAVNIRVTNQIAYVADSTGLRTLNISNPAAPFQIGSWTNVPTPGASGGQLLTVAPFGTNVFVGGDTVVDFRSLNVSNPSNLFHTSSHDLSTQDGIFRGSRIGGEFAFLAVSGFGLAVFDVKTPATPVYAGRFDTPGVVTDVELINSHALVADGINGLIVLGGFPGSNAPPVILDEPISRTVATGTNASLSMTCDGSLPLRFQWYRDGELLAGKTNSWLGFTNTHPSNSALYQIVATNDFGYVTSTLVQLTVLVPVPKLVLTGMVTNGFRFSFTSLAGMLYIVEFKNSLASGVWAELERRFGVGGVEIVTDPSANGTMRFYRVRALYAPSPKLGAATWSGGAVNFSFATAAGAQYVVEYTDQLAPPQWNELQTISGTGSSIGVADPAPIGPQRFYRLRVR